MSNPVIKYWNNGQQMMERYYNDYGFSHRKNGPAVLYFNRNGQIITEEYWINGKLLDKFEIRKLKLEKLNLL